MRRRLGHIVGHTGFYFNSTLTHDLAFSFVFLDLVASFAFSFVFSNFTLTLANIRYLYIVSVFDI